jgi:hypothetical protein
MPVFFAVFLKIINIPYFLHTYEYYSQPHKAGELVPRHRSTNNNIEEYHL